MSHKIALFLVVAALAACTRDEPAPPPTDTHTATAASSTAALSTAAPVTAAPATAAPTPTAGVQKGPHSPLADVDLPPGVVYAGASSDEERWGYSAPYDDAVEFLRKQFATGPKNDPQAAPWWRDLPPCYNDAHESPPGGWVTEDSTRWVWADDNIALSVAVYGPRSPETPNVIVIDYERRDDSHVCIRS